MLIHLRLRPWPLPTALRSFSTSRHKLFSHSVLVQQNHSTGDLLRQFSTSLPVKDRFYTSKHEGLELDGGKPVKGTIGTAGITEFAQQEEVKPKQYKTPEDWLTAAKWELSHGDLHQASEKLYAAGRKALDILAATGMIALGSHNAANEFVQFIVREKFRRQNFKKLWYKEVNVAHANYYKSEFPKDIVEDMVPEIERFVLLASEVRLTEAICDHFLEAAKKKGLHVEDGRDGMRLVVDKRWEKNMPLLGI